MEKLVVGLEAEKEEIVTEDITAINFGSGSVAVYATPAMLALMEASAVLAADPLLSEGLTTVGISVDIKHLSATPLGMKVKAVARLEKIDGKKLKFKIEAYDERGLIGQGKHSRFIVEKEKFIKNTEAK